MFKIIQILNLNYLVIFACNLLQLTRAINVNQADGISGSNSREMIETIKQKNKSMFPDIQSRLFVKHVSIFAKYPTYVYQRNIWFQLCLVRTYPLSKARFRGRGCNNNCMIQILLLLENSSQIVGFLRTTLKIIYFRI